MHYFGQPEETLHLKELQEYQLLTADDEDTFCSDTTLSETETISIDPQFLHHGDLREFVDDWHEGSESKAVFYVFELVAQFGYVAVSVASFDSVVFDEAA